MSTRRSPATDTRRLDIGIADAAYRLQAYARGLYADARSMRESSPELASGHAERAAALALAARVLLDVDSPTDFDACAVHARATRCAPADLLKVNMVRARATSTLQQAAAGYEADARAAEIDPARSAFTPEFHRAQAAELHEKYGELDPLGVG